MRIQVVSDLHLEFHNLLPPVADGVDVIVCAGDLAPIGTGAVRYAAEEWAEARHILYVPGNHEFYGTDIDRARNQLAEECYSLGITLLDSDAIVMELAHGVRTPVPGCSRAATSMQAESSAGDRTWQSRPAWPSYPRQGR